MTPTELNEITGKIIEFSIKVQIRLGAGCWKGVRDLPNARARTKWIQSRKAKELPIAYDGVRLHAGYRIDLLVNDLVIVEVKAVERLHAAPRGSIALVPSDDKCETRTANQFQYEIATG